MESYRVAKSSLSGVVTIPPSKSHTHRAILFALMANGTSTIYGYLNSPDTMGMVEAARKLGAKIALFPDKLVITGVSGKIGSCRVINAGNSGIILRFVGALLALGHSPVELTGDASIQSQRPIEPLLDAINQLGGSAHSLKGNSFAPISVCGPLKSGEITIDGADSQFVSSLLIALSFANGPFTIHVTNPGEKPWVALTLSWLDFLGLSYTNDNFTTYTVPGNGQIQAFEKTIPGDFSSAAFPLCAALITQSPLTIENIDMTDAQGDKKVIKLLRQMGAQIEETERSLVVSPTKELKGLCVDINDTIDAITILAVMGCYAKGTTEIVNGAIARTKECDRIAAIVTELKKMGAIIEEKPDGIVVQNSPLKGAKVNTYRDQRMVMSLTVAALGASSPTTIIDTKSVHKTYPPFASHFQQIGAKLEVIS